MRIFKILLLLVFAGGSVLADTTQTYTSSSVRFARLKDMRDDSISFKRLDTSLNKFQNFNPLTSQDIPSIYLGNLGTAIMPMFYSPDTRIGFRDGRYAFDRYLKQPEDIRFYRTLTPYTQITYFWSRVKEQKFDVAFAQNINPRLNYAVNFGRLVSVGDYARQKSDNLTYDASVWYTSKNRRYRLLTAWLSNSIKIQENGGIRNDSIFRVSSQVSTEFEPVYLNNASNRIEDKTLFIMQSFAFGRKDTLKLDTANVIRIEPRQRFTHEFRYNKREYSYKETPVDSGLYTVIIFDSTNTSDYIRLNRMSNKLDYALIGRSSGVFRDAGVSLQHELINYSNNGFDTTFNLLRLEFRLGFALSRSMHIDLRATPLIIGDFGSDYVYTFAWNYLLADQQKLSLNAFTSRASAPVSYQRYLSNRYQWQYNFSPVDQSAAGIRYQHTKYKFFIGLQVSQVKNLVYFDSLMTARQNNSDVNIWQVQLSKNFQLGKFHLDNIVYLQHSSEQEIIRQPALHTYNSFYFESPLFKKAMTMRIGIDSRYYTSYKGYAYDPATTQFYHESSRSFGDYPLIDAFVSARIKRAILMLKLDHANDQLFKRGDYMLAGYPLPARLLKIGLSWAFYD